VTDWPTATVLKLKLVAESERTGWGWLGVERGETLAQPAMASVIANEDAAAATLPIDRYLEKRENTLATNPLRFRNFKLLFEEE